MAATPTRARPDTRAPLRLPGQTRRPAVAAGTLLTGWRVALLCGLAVLAAVLVLLTISLGAVRISLSEVVRALIAEPTREESWTYLVRELRAPRALTALLCGAALGVAGLMMQTLFRNALADPYLLGIHAGASLGVSLLVLGGASSVGSLLLQSSAIGNLGLVAASAAGATGTMVVMLAAAAAIRSGVVVLILGVMLNAFVMALVNLLVYLADPDSVKTYVDWTASSFQRVLWGAMPTLVIVVVVGVTVAVSCMKQLNLFLLGETYAESLGVAVQRFRWIAMLAAATLSGAVTAYCGPIAFLGIAAPHGTGTAPHGRPPASGPRVRAARRGHRPRRWHPHPAARDRHRVAAQHHDVLARRARRRLGPHPARPPRQADGGVMRSEAAESVDHDRTGLTATRLSVGYRARAGSRVVLRDLDLAARAGELVCLLGANGTGKSTLMRTLGGLQTPLAGTVALGGRAVHAMSHIERARRLALVLTTRVSVERLSGHELVQTGRAPYTGWAGNLDEEDHRVVRWALELTRSEALVDRPLDELSDGERQRLMIARALAQQPQVMLLDEPTAFLDAPRRAELTGMLRDLTRGSQIAVVLSTHDIELALRNADVVWLVTPAGQLIADTPEQLVLTGVLEEAFPHPSYAFDAWAGGFQVRVRGRGRARVRAPRGTLAAIWTSRTLERFGYQVVPDGNADLTVDLIGDDEHPRWQLTAAGQTSTFDSLSALAAALSAGSTAVKN